VSDAAPGRSHRGGMGLTSTDLDVGGPPWDEGDFDDESYDEDNEVEEEDDEEETSEGTGNSIARPCSQDGSSSLTGCKSLVSAMWPLQ
jgi:hypothetical protein